MSLLELEVGVRERGGSGVVRPAENVGDDDGVLLALLAIHDCLSENNIHVCVMEFIRDENQIIINILNSFAHAARLNQKTGRPADGVGVVLNND